MTENVLPLSGDKPHPLQHPRALEAILYGGLAVGVLGGFAAVVITTLRGGSPTRMLHGIAGGPVGRGSFQGGWPTGLLGVTLQFLIAFILAAFYYGPRL